MPAAVLNPPVVLTLAAKVTVLPAVLLSTAIDAALTMPLNVAPPELFTVIVPISVPMAPLTSTAPEVLKARFEDAPPETPLIAPVVIVDVLPAPSVSVFPS